jgi:hypothetical protein
VNVRVQRAEASTVECARRATRHDKLVQLRVCPCHTRRVVSIARLNHLYRFPTAAAFFEITRGQAEALFSGRNGRCVTTTQVIENIDQLLARPRSQDDSEVARNARRQAVIDGLLVKANKAAQKARRGVTTLIAIFF